MLRDGQWHPYDTECQWMSLDALKVVHRVTPVVKGARYSITLYTPGKLDRLTAQDWDNLARTGFPIYLYEPLSAKMRRLTTPSHVMSLTSEPQTTQLHTGSLQVAREQYRHRSYEALTSHYLANNEHLWDNLPVPSVAEYDLNDGFDPRSNNIRPCLQPEASQVVHCQNIAPSARVKCIHRRLISQWW